jgi:hypothetical protein
MSAREDLVKRCSQLAKALFLPLVLGACDRRASTPSPPKTAGAEAVPSERAVNAGWMIGETYSISVATDHNAKVIRFEQVVGKDLGGRSTFKVLDMLVVAPLDSSEVLVGFYCRLHQNPDARIVAIAVYQDGPLFTTIHRAWQADTLTHRFRHMPVQGIDCQNEGRGA